MKTDAEIEEMMDQMKAEGRSAEEVGYAVSKEIYGENATRSMLTAFLIGIEIAESSIRNAADDGFVAGSRKFCEEQLARFNQ